MKRKWYQDNQGNISALRLIVVPAGLIGMIAVLASLVAMFMNNPFSVGMAGIGAGMVSTAVAAKAWQKKHEEESCAKQN